MPLIYITGTPGSGKSAVLRELQDRGYKAYGTDEHDYSRWLNRKTNEVVIPPEKYDLHAWYKNHEWTLSPDAITKLRHEADTSEEVVFLCGVAAGTDEVWRYFSHVIILTADAQTLKHRIANRTDNNFGKNPEELKIILEWQDKHVGLYRERGATTVDTAKPVAEVVDAIIESYGKVT